MLPEISSWAARAGLVQLKIAQRPKIKHWIKREPLIGKTKLADATTDRDSVKE
jgi:hypothetical protein